MVDHTDTIAGQRIGAPPPGAEIELTKITSLSDAAQFIAGHSSLPQRRPGAGRRAEERRGHQQRTQE